MSFSVKDKKVIVTGGCGFIGSYVVDWAIKNDAHEVIVIDNLSAVPDLTNIKEHVEAGRATFLKKDIREINPDEDVFSGADIVFHFAAQPSVPISVEEPYMDFQINVEGSMRILEAMRTNNVPFIVFAASGGTMYGEADQIVNEESALRPISNYGAAKAAFEMYLSSYSHLYEMGAISLRFGNIFGPRSTHGVMFDFFQKLVRNPKKLQILGNGMQTKSYLYITDLIRALDYLVPTLQKGVFEPFNVSTNRTAKVVEIADLVVKSMGLSNVEYEFTGGERGWPGDVRKIFLSTEKINALGWEPIVSLEEGVSKYIEFLKRNYE